MTLILFARELEFWNFYSNLAIKMKSKQACCTKDYRIHEILEHYLSQTFSICIQIIIFVVCYHNTQKGLMMVNTRRWVGLVTIICTHVIRSKSPKTDLSSLLLDLNIEEVTDFTLLGHYKYTT